jgi:C_GCAxxG_C_C family probable redox protein
LEKMQIENAEVVKALGLFGGGISGTGGICGVFTGGIALISSIYSRGTLQEKESPDMWRLGHILDNKFGELTREFGGKNCSQIARVDWMDRDQVKNLYQGVDGRFKYCLELAEKTAQFLGEILEKEAAGKG